MRSLALNRRQFLRRTAVAAGFAAAWPHVLRAETDRTYDAVRLGMIGLRSKGADHVSTFLQLSGARIVALCDVDREILAREQQRVEKTGLKVAAHVDARELLDRSDIDAIVIATPNHWHSLLTVWGCQAGKDVYVEKPVSHEVWEGRKLIEAARKYKRVVQAGTQSRSDPALQEAFSLLRTGALGGIKVIRGFCYKRRATIGKVSGPQPIPASVDYNLWSGPAPMAPLMRKSLHYDWHWVWPTGNGDIGNQGIHEMDMCRWVSGHAELPPAVMSMGGRFGYVDDGETPNTQIAFFDYRPAPIIFEVRGLPIAKDYEGEAMDNYKSVRIGVVVECEHGYFAGGGGGGWFFDAQGKRLRQFTGPGGRDHQTNFLDAVRSRKVGTLNAEVGECHVSSALCHLANISHRLGHLETREAVLERVRGQADTAEAFQRFEEHLAKNSVDLGGSSVTLGPWLKLNPRRERFAGELAKPANALLRRDYRKPFEIRDRV